MVSVATVLFNMQIYEMLSYGRFHHYAKLQVIMCSLQEVLATGNELPPSSHPHIY